MVCSVSCGGWGVTLPTPLTTLPSGTATADPVGGVDNPGCDYGESYDEAAANLGVDTEGDAYQVPGALASLFGAHSGEHPGVFGAKPNTRSGKPTYGDRAAKGRRGTITGPTTTKTHWARVEVTRDGQLVVTYTVRSGSMTSSESQSSSHTETRTIRMSGTTSYSVNGDRYANMAPVQRGDTITIHGLKPPCTNCRNRMSQAAEELGVTFIYKQGSREWSWGNR
ncbi:hypothetical protein [Streptomyces sp. 2131.1]|uniref:hypothetical protein n=1 Tax=Streptomyces sp. 2131.1 TaxID=1855346 RepID=UPI0035240B94